MPPRKSKKRTLSELLDEQDFVPTAADIKALLLDTDDSVKKKIYSDPIIIEDITKASNLTKKGEKTWVTKAKAIVKGQYSVETKETEITKPKSSNSKNPQVDSELTNSEKINSPPLSVSDRLSKTLKPGTPTEGNSYVTYSEWRLHENMPCRSHAQLQKTYKAVLLHSNCFLGNYDPDYEILEDLLELYWNDFLLFLDSNPGIAQVPTNELVEVLKSAMIIQTMDQEELENVDLTEDRFCFLSKDIKLEQGVYFPGELDPEKVNQTPATTKTDPVQPDEAITAESSSNTINQTSATAETDPVQPDEATTAESSSNPTNQTSATAETDPVQPDEATTAESSSNPTNQTSATAETDPVQSDEATMAESSSNPISPSGSVIIASGASQSAISSNGIDSGNESVVMISPTTISETQLPEGNPSIDKVGQAVPGKTSSPATSPTDTKTSGDLSDQITIEKAASETPFQPSVENSNAKLDSTYRTKTGKVKAAKELINPEDYKMADITTKAGIEIIVKHNVVRGATVQTIENDIQFINDSWRLFSAESILPHLRRTIDQYDMGVREVSALEGFDNKKVLIFQQLTSARKEQAWGSVREAVALYDLHLDIEKAGEAKIGSGVGNLVSKSKSKLYNEYLYMEAGGKDKYLALSQKAQQRHRVSWTDNKAIGAKFSKFVEIFGEGILLVLPRAALEKIGNKKFAKWTTTRASSLAEAVSRSPEFPLLKKLSDVVGTFLRPLLLGKISPAKCIELLDLFETDNNLEKTVIEQFIPSLPTLAPQEKPVETATQDIVEIQILEFPGRFGMVGLKKETCLLRSSLSSLKQREWLDDGAVYASILCHEIPDDIDVVDPLVTKVDGYNFEIKPGIKKLIMPLLVSENHWILAVVHLLGAKVEVDIYDSLWTQAHIDEACELIKNSGIVAEPISYSIKKCTRQANGFDCGIMVIATAVELMGGVKVPSWVDENWGIFSRGYYAMLCTDSAKLHALESPYLKKEDETGNPAV